MQLEIWTISGQGFHFGRHGLGQEESSVHLPSDSLFAALTARVAVLQGEAGVQAWMAHFLDQPPALALTSAFPRAGDVCFYPLPLRTARQEADAGGIALKDLKKLKYVSETLFRRLLDGVPLAQQFDPARVYQSSQVLVAPEDVPRLPAEVREQKSPVWQVEQRPRVALGRVQVNSTLYHTGRTGFGPGCGLWFGVLWARPEAGLRSQLVGLLDDLGHAGLGGERASGFGSASFQPSGAVELPAGAGQPWVSLSRYLPDEPETGALLDGRAAYTIETAGGWVQSPGKKAERRRNIHMLAEGSVLGPLEALIPGRLVDVQPDYTGSQPLGHPVWRNGTAVAAGFNPGALEARTP